MNVQGKTFPEGELVIYIDYARSKHAGAMGCFQVVDICIDGDIEISILNDIAIDQGTHYFEVNEVLKDLGIDPTHINYREEVIS